MMFDCPEAFLKNMRRLLGGEYAAFERALNEPPVRALRQNPLRPLDVPGERVPWEPDGRYVDADLRPGQDLNHFSGAYYMQEPSAMAPARVLDVQPGELVLDLCAAPGGKSGQLAAALGGQGVLVSNEPDPRRAQMLGGNLERLGVPNAIVTSMLPHQLPASWEGLFDSVLVDAPCSGEGMFRRDPASRGEWSEGAPEGCARRQLEILRHAARMVRRSGRLVYSTCTFNDTENEGVVRRFLGEYPHFCPVPFSLPGADQSEGGMMRLLPHRARGEGQFMALMQRADGPPSAGFAPEGPPADSAPLTQLEREIGGCWPELVRDAWLCLSGDLLCAVPAKAPPLRGVRVLRRGLHLCHLGKGFVKPDHALVMALSPDQVDRTLELDAADARRFVRGHEIPCPEPLAGWTLITHNQMPLGWGKAVQGTIKNHIPKGLRLN